MKYTRIIFIFSFIFSSLYAQGGGSNGSFDARSIGMGFTSLISSRGTYAINSNPANLALKDNNKIEIFTVLPLPNINLSIGNDFFTLNDYNYFFTGVESPDGSLIGRHLTLDDKTRFLNLLDDGTSARSSFAINYLSVSFYANPKVGSFAFSVRDWGGARFEFPKELAELLLYGNQRNHIFDLSNADLNAWYLRDYALTYSRELTQLFPKLFEQFSAGLSLKLVHGYFYSGIEKINTTIETLNDHTIHINNDLLYRLASSPDFGLKYDFEKDTLKNSNVGLFNDPAGVGFGIDFGLNAKLNNVWSIGFAITDIGSINWKKETVSYTSSTDFLFDDVTDQELVDSLSEAISGQGAYTGSFSTSLGSALSLGVGFRLDEFLPTPFPGSLLIELNYHQGFNNLPSNTTKPRFSLGFEWDPINWLLVRTGFSAGGFDKFNWAVGLGFNAGFGF